jgi:preprotein translocase subunit SecG
MGLGQTLLLVLLFITAIILIVLVLIQRGKGGGLAGALGGMGGQSAFGTKAGDLFTKITIVVAFVWILLCLAAGKALIPRSDLLNDKSLGVTEQKDRPGPADANNANKPAEQKPDTPEPSK